MISPLIKLSLSLSVLMMLTGCASNPPQAPESIRQVAQIETTGVKLIQQGDRLMVIIPTDYYFEPQSARVNPDHEKGLTAIAKFVKNFADQYPNSAIRVTGYTDNVFDQTTQVKLSQAYAETIGSYLFNAGIPLKRLALQGRGSNEPIASESEPSSKAMNRRVIVQVN
jgi:outer membrane protein OmpA-like peptidoglycan-associated protein